MSRLGCLCGNGMSNSMVPSESMAEIYGKDEIERAAGECMALIDLSDERHEFWYCQKCRRITVIDRASGQYLRSYARKVLDVPMVFESIKDWKELLFWRDREFYEAIEKTGGITVGDFVRQHPSRYLSMISSDKTIIHVFKPQTKAYLFSYVQDQPEEHPE